MILWHVSLLAGIPLVINSISLEIQRMQDYVQMDVSKDIVLVTAIHIDKTGQLGMTKLLFVTF